MLNLNLFKKKCLFKYLLLPLAVRILDLSNNIAYTCLLSFRTDLELLREPHPFAVLESKLLHFQKYL